MKFLIEAFISVFLQQDAKKDEAVRKAYKYLASLHEVNLKPFNIISFHQKEENLFELSRMVLYTFSSNIRSVSTDCMLHFATNKETE